LAAAASGLGVALGPTLRGLLLAVRLPETHYATTDGWRLFSVAVN